jgi:hypothetical protein
MFDWLQKKSQRGGHPMLNPAEAARLLAELPADDPLRATEEVTAWLESLARATRFGTAQRVKVVAMVDETGQPFAEALMTEYLADENSQKADRFRRWQVLMNFWEKLAEAYSEIVGHFQLSERTAPKDQMPLVTVRAMRAVFVQMRLALMRYAGEPDRSRTWSALYRLFSFALQQQCATSPVRLYPSRPHTTNPRLELVSAVLLEVAAPQTLPPRQIELTARIASRLASAAAFSDQLDERLYFYVDLAKHSPPNFTRIDLQVTPTMRFFGPGNVVVRLNESSERIRNPQPSAPDEGFGEGYSAKEQLETLQRLTAYWGDSPPRRQHARTRFASRVEVVFGLDAVVRVVGKLEQVITGEKFEILFDDKRAPEDKPAGAAFETWTLKDISLRGLGALTTRRAQGALKIGALIAFRLENAEEWCLGIVRRLQVDRQNNSDVGAEILSRHPQLFWLKKPDAPKDDVWNWETRRDDATSHHYLKTILLPADKETGDDASLLVERGNYVTGQPYSAQIEKKIRPLRFSKVLETGENYERVAFVWLD